MSSRRVVLVPGDGIGPEVTSAARRVLDATGVPLAWEVHEVGAAVFEREGEALPAAVVDAVREAGVALKGPVSTPKDGAFRSVNVRLRQELDLFLQVRRCRSPQGVDVLVARETTEDLYAGIEVAADDRSGDELRLRFGLSPATALGIKPVTEQAVRRAARALAAYAEGLGRTSITIVHKATAMPATDGLFLQAARRELPGADDMAVDLAAAELVRRPTRFDVLFTGNLYGDILADLAGAVAGGIGVVPGVNLGDGVSVFEPAHGSAPRHAGHDRANPTAAVLSGASLLRAIGEGEAAARVEAAVERVLAEGRSVTYDVARPGTVAASTSAMADAVIQAMA